MKKDSIRDYATEAFRFYAKSGGRDKIIKKVCSSGGKLYVMMCIVVRVKRTGNRSGFYFVETIFT